MPNAAFVHSGLERGKVELPKDVSSNGGAGLADRLLGVQVSLFVLYRLR